MRPYVVLHNAVSVDGRLDRFMADIGRFYRLASSWHEDVTLAGSNTIVAGDPGTAEYPDNGQVVAEGGPEAPLLAVVDSGGRVRDWRPLLASGHWRGGLALLSERTPADHIERLARQGVESLVLGADQVDLDAALAALSQRGAKTVRVDSGGGLNGALLRAGLVDEVSLVIEPCLVGGTSASSMFRAPDLDQSGCPLPLEIVRCERLADGAVWLVYRVQP